jgi:tetratricopeptide (TPR) repeat protein
LVKWAAISGLLLAVGLCGLLLFLALRPDRYFGFNESPGVQAGDLFHRLLRDYDLVFEASRGDLDSERLATLSDMLDKLEKNTQGVESWLSLLKRRRALAEFSPRYLLLYRAVGRRAAETFPFSEPLAAIAAASAIKDAPIDTETAKTLKNYRDLINDTRLTPLALGISILNGDFNSPALAASARGEALLGAGLPIIRPTMAENSGDRLIVNLALLRLVKGDYRGAEAQLRGITRPDAPEIRRFLGEYYYDFGDPLRAAEIFHQAGDEAGLLRSADALWLGGKAENARNIWLTLGNARSLYNLAASAPSAQEQGVWFTRLYQAGQNDAAFRGDPLYRYGLVGYTRSLPPYEALALLEGREDEAAATTGQATRDLEILRRRGELWSLDRTVAETWLLLGRYPEDSRLYQWAAWYFDYQRRYEETAMLIKTAGYRNIRGPWLDLNTGLRDLEAGRLDQAEEQLRAIASDPRNRELWQAEANLGLILESRHAPGEALEHYEIAAGRVGDNILASRLQLRIAGCLLTMGRAEESRRVLLYSLDLNPDNLAARLELRRLESQLL